MDESREKFFGCECEAESIEIYTFDYEDKWNYDIEFIHWVHDWGEYRGIWDRICILWNFLIGSGWNKCFASLHPKKAREMANYILSECDRMDKVLAERKKKA